MQFVFPLYDEDVHVAYFEKKKIKTTYTVVAYRFWKAFAFAIASAVAFAFAFASALQYHETTKKLSG